MTDALASDGLTPSPERRIPRHPNGVKRGEAQIALDFAAPVLATPTRAIRPYVRENGTLASQRAAVDVLPKMSKLERRIMEILATIGPQYAPEGMTDRELETMREFARYGPSTVRRRRTTLFQQGRLVENGVRDKLTVWRVADSAHE